VTLLDLTTAFGTFANGGELVRPHPILKVADSTGQVLYDLAADQAGLTPQRALDAGTAYIITDILADNNARSPAFGSRSPLYLGVPAAVKTGTTNDYRDNWTVGYTPYLVVGVWAGNNDNHPMKNSSGVTGAAPIWNAFMRSVVNDKDRLAVVRGAREQFGHELTTAFRRPKNVVEGSVCNLRSLNLIAPACPESRRELFLTGTQPEQDVWISADAVAVALPPPPEPAEGEQRPPAPVQTARAMLCLPNGPEYGQDKVQSLAVLPLPENDEEEARHILEWAGASGWRALPPVEPCSPEMIAAAMDPGALGTVSVDGVYTGTLASAPLPSHAQARLNLAPGSTLTGRTVLTGTVRYDPAQVEYFKVELGRGRPPSEWITLGDVHREQVQDGLLEVLDAPSLPEGDYLVRLVLVGKDGNFLGEPHSVPLVIGRAPLP
jgi:hypothetical protein